jgi:hypothetical protein
MASVFLKSRALKPFYWNIYEKNENKSTMKREYDYANSGS